MRISAIAIAFLMFGHLGHAAQEVGNGGDLIICRASPQNSFVGTLALDYVLTYQKEAAVQPASLDDSLNRIEKNIAEKVPGLLESLKHYRKSLLNRTDPNLPYLWLPISSGLVNVKDEDLNSAERVPENCRTGELIPLLQAVIRQDPDITGSNTVVTYKYVEDPLNQVAQENPLQASFLLIHEWLWNLSDNVHRNRQIGQFFHSRRFDTMQPDEVERYLTGLGLKIPSYVPDLFNGPVCETSDFGVRRAIHGRLKRYAAANSLPETVDIPIGTFHARSIKRTCYGGSRCTDWYESTYLTDQLQSVGPKLVAAFNIADLFNGPVRFLGGDPSGDLQSFTSCSMPDELGTVNCSALRNPEDGEFISLEGRIGYNLYLRGKTNGVCTHLTEQGRGVQTPTYFMEWKFALFFWFDK